MSPTLNCLVYFAAFASWSFEYCDSVVLHVADDNMRVTPDAFMQTTRPDKMSVTASAAELTIFSKSFKIFDTSSRS